MSTFEIEPRYDADGDAYSIVLSSVIMSGRKEPELFAACVIEVHEIVKRFVECTVPSAMRVELAFAIVDWIKEKGERYDVG